MDSQNLVKQQFSSTAENYFQSAVHAQGKDLSDLIILAQQLKPGRALDLGCGPGHVSLNLSKEATEVIAYDLSDTMLSVLSRIAEERELKNIVCQKGTVEKLPFPDQHFDLIVTRFSAHHWLNLQDALHEMRRVLKTNGTIVIIDVTAPSLAHCDTALQTVEILRDASHVRDYSLKEWHNMISEAGFNVTHETSWKLPIEFASWIKRINTPINRVEALKVVIDAFPSEVKNYFHFDQSYSFEFDVTWFQMQLKITEDFA